MQTHSPHYFLKIAWQFLTRKRKFNSALLLILFFVKTKLLGWVVLPLSAGAGAVVHLFAQQTLLEKLLCSMRFSSY